MKDEQQEVRKGGIIAAVKFIEVMGVETINSLYANLKTASEDPKWRVRLELIKNIAELGYKMENSEVFLKHFEPLYTIYLKDRAACIRKHGVSCIGKLGQSYKSTWLDPFTNKLIELIQKESSYHYKISAIYSLKEVCLVSQENLEKGTNAIIKACQDSVPNVREVCVKCLKEIGVRWEKSPIKEVVKKQLAVMQNDTDKEVKELAVEVSGKV